MTNTAAFIRPVDLDLVGKLARARLIYGQSNYSYDIPDILREPGAVSESVLKALCDTERFFFEPDPESRLIWSDAIYEPSLGWSVESDGCQRLRFLSAEGVPLDLGTFGKEGIWLERSTGRLGALHWPVSDDVLRFVNDSPVLEPGEVAVVAPQLPKQLGAMRLPSPRVPNEKRRAAEKKTVRLVLSAATARNGYARWDPAISLPTLTLAFLYEGHQAASDSSADIRFVDGSDLVTLERDFAWEVSAVARLQQAGAIPVEALEHHLASDEMLKFDLVFVDGEFNPLTQEMSRERDALDFTFAEVPKLLADGWDVDITSKWPFQLSNTETQLVLTSAPQSGTAFQGHAWFDLGFKVEIAGKTYDLAPLIAAFLSQIWDEIDKDNLPTVEAVRERLAQQPVYIAVGGRTYVPVDLSPIAAVLHLFLHHYAEHGSLHPAEASLAAEAAEALEGSNVRFQDNAGILPLAQSLKALRETAAAAPPAGLNAELRAYQAFGAAWMSSLVQAGFGGVLADDMGLGKTLQVLSLLQARKETHPSQEPALLVVPTSLLYSWQEQAAQFTPELRLLVLHGPQRQRHHDKIADADLVITTYPLLARDLALLASRTWGLLIIDEAQTLKNPSAQMAKALREIPAKGRLALTGTPLENSLQDLWTLFDWVVPGLLGDRKTFQTVFRTPIEKHGNRSAQVRLNRRLRPFLLRRTKEEVAAELPPRTEILDRVDLPKAQQALYETVRSVMDTRVRNAIAARGLRASRITILDALLKLRQVCCDPALAKTEAARSVTESAKRQRLRELLEELVAEGRRVLVFSQFVAMLELISSDLKEKGVEHVILTGQTTKRSEVLQTFKEGTAPVFLLSLKAGGVGLTLTEADTVILYDPWWNPAVERQAMDRVHRIGQDKPVFVHRLVASGTVEEKILDLQAKKQALADALFSEDGEERADGFLDESVLADLFAPLKAS